MKKTILIILVFSFVNEVNGQMTEGASYDFCQCDYFSTIRDSTRNSSRLGIDNNTSIEVTHYKGKVVNFKQYHRQNNVETIRYEYIRLDADTFRFIEHEYDTLRLKLAAGNVYFDRKQIRSDSTFVRYDGDTYERFDDTTIYHFYQPVKHGKWYERKGNDQMGGHYEHGKKQGVWKTLNFETHSWKELEFVNDSLIREEELNLVKKENARDEIIELLTKDVLFSTWDKEGTYIRSFGPEITRLKFNKDGIVTYFGRHHSSSFKRDWVYNEENKTIEIEGGIFEIIRMMGDFIELKLIE